jgi:hypothetical protein
MNRRRVAAGVSVIVLVLCLIVAGCQTIPDPEIPPQEKASSTADANALLRQYQLSKVGHMYWGAYFLQGQDVYRYPYQRISGLFQFSSDEARTEYRKGSDQALWASVMGGVSGGLIGYPFGWYVGGGEWTTTDLVLLGGGLVSGVVSVILSVIADGSFEDAVLSYNRHLKDTFGAE